MLILNSNRVSIIQPASKWQGLNLKELKDYQDLFYFMVWRDIKVLYAQTIMGFSWALLQPLVQIILFTIVFGKVAKVPSEGLPYFLFATVAIVPWTYISQAVTESSQSLIAGQNMLGKVYFPRIIFPLTPVLSKLIDFGISLLIVVITMLYYRVHPTWNLLFLPIFLLLMIIIAAGAGMWLSALAIRFRDVRHSMGFVVRILMYSAPIVYSASTIPDKYRLIYSLNPIVCVIEGFRACLLGGHIVWMYILPGAITSLVFLIGGIFYFRKMEHVFVDVI
ncbi:MAG: ABC transporter permease [Proteobacteria bacterium]|nr:ABC transporter permease [Pseudomonadota bacterium]